MNDLDFVAGLRAGVPEPPSARLAAGRARLTAAISAGISPVPVRSGRLRPQARKLWACTRHAQPEAIVARGRARQRGRLAGLSVAGAAAVAAAILGVSAVIGSGGSAPTSSVRLDAFSVVSNPDGTVTVSIHLGRLMAICTSQPTSVARPGSTTEANPAGSSSSARLSTSPTARRKVSSETYMAAPPQGSRPVRNVRIDASLISRFSQAGAHHVPVLRHWRTATAAAVPSCLGQLVPSGFRAV